MKDVKLKCIYSGPVRGDCCSHSQYEPVEPTTVRELCEYILSTHEWGYIGINPHSNTIASIFGDPCIEYASGQYKTPLESRFSEEILDSYVETVDWDGGWSKGDWLFTLK